MAELAFTQNAVSSDTVQVVSDQWSEYLTCLQTAVSVAAVVAITVAITIVIAVHVNTCK